MVKGLQRFRDHFQGSGDAFIVIGGVACDQWLGQQGLRFRPTKDIDMVLVLEALNSAFVARFWEFIRAGNYTKRHRSTGERIYYRFSEPTEPEFPLMLELFSRQPEGIDLGAGQDIVPLPVDNGLSSLSAILMDDAYYGMIRGCRTMAGDLPIISVTGLIPLKARAWLDLTRRRDAGEQVDERDIKKHRRDVFRLAAALPGQPGPELAETIRDDLRRFIAAFPPDADVWTDLRKSLREDLGAAMPQPSELLSAIRQYFRLDADSKEP